MGRALRDGQQADRLSRSDKNGFILSLSSNVGQQGGTTKFTVNRGLSAAFLRDLQGLDL